MKDVGKQPRLWKRGSTYYLRVKVPEELRAIIKLREIKESLNTRDYHKALELVRAASARADAQLAAARRKLGKSTTTKRADVSKHELQQLALIWLHQTEIKQAEAAVADAAMSEEQRELASVDLANELGALRALDNKDDPDGLIMVAGVIDQLLESNDLKLEPNDPSYRLLFGFVRRAMMENARRQRHRLETGDNNKPFDEMFGQVFADGARPTVSAANSVTVNQLIDRYRADPARAGLAQGTWDKYNTVFRLMREELGAKTPIRDVSRADFSRMRDILATVPSNTTKKFPGKRFADVAEMAKQKGLAPMNVTTANNHLQTISALFRFALNEEWIDKNRAHGLRITRAHELREEERRLPFDTEQLQKIFRAAQYAGEKRRAKRDGRFFVPLLSLWTGMRLNECCQLAVDDIQRKDGTDVILVRETGDGDKQLKTRAATRMVPIHRELRQIGFLHYVAAQKKAGHKRLFPELPKSRRGYYSDLFSKWWGRFQKAAHAKKDRTSFHSFRHNFRDAMRDAHVPGPVATALGGWEDSGTDATYGSGYKASTLAVELEKISYPGLDLSHLHP